MNVTGAGGAGGIGGIGGAGGAGQMGGGDQLSTNQTQTLQSLTGMSEQGVNDLASGFAERNGMSISDAGDQLIAQLQNTGAANAEEGGAPAGGAPAGGAPAGGAPAEGGAPAGGAAESGGADLMEDKNQNGIPDIIEEMVASGDLSMEDAVKLLESMGVDSKAIESFQSAQEGNPGGGESGGFDFTTDKQPPAAIM